MSKSPKSTKFGDAAASLAAAALDFACNAANQLTAAAAGAGAGAGAGAAAPSRMAQKANAASSAGVFKAASASLAPAHHNWWWRISSRATYSSVLLRSYFWDAKRSASASNSATRFAILRTPQVCYGLSFVFNETHLTGRRLDKRNRSPRTHAFLLSTRF